MDDIKRRHGQDRVSKRIVEQIVGVTVAHVMEDIVDVVKQIVQGMQFQVKASEVRVLQ